MKIHDLPDWQKLVSLIGEESAAALSAEFGGGRMSVPRLLGAHHPITVLVGREAADLIAAEFGGLKVEIPMAMGKRAMVLQLTRAGVPVPTICRKVGVSRRQVFYVRAEAEAAKASVQPDLFKGKS